MTQTGGHKSWHMAKDSVAGIAVFGVAWHGFCIA